MGKPRFSPDTLITTRTATVIAAVSAVTAAALAIFAVVLRLRTPDLDMAIVGSNTVGAATMGVIGCLVVARRPRLVVPWLLCVNGLFLALFDFGYALLVMRATENMRDPVIPYIALGMFWCAVIYAFAGQMLLPLIYPNGRLPSLRWRLVLMAVVATLLVKALAGTFGVHPRFGTSPFAVATLAPITRPINDHGTTIVIMLMATCILSLVVRFRRADSIERRQIAWLLLAVAADLLAERLVPDTWVTMVTTAAVPTAVAVAVLRYRLYGIDTLVSRALVGAGLITVIGTAYLGIGALTGVFLSGFDRLAGLAAALFAGLFFQPLRRLLQRLVDRALYGKRGDPRALAQLLQERIRHAEPHHALAAGLEVISDGLSVAGVTVEVDNEQIRAEHGRLGDVRRAIPLLWHGTRVGSMTLGDARPGHRRAAAHDERMIAAVVPFIADLAHAAKMAADLQRSRERILTARDEERRRLRRDLHDGLGQRLTGMAMQLHLAAGNGHLLHQLRTEMESVNGEIKELVYGLRPPALDELGLADAVQALAPEATVHIDAALDELPAAVEVAAYRIIQEAVTNSRRHAPAHAVHIELHRDRGLHLTVRDDGPGLPDHHRSGIGLTSMRERAAELGGTCHITSPPTGGTLVEARIPL